MLCYNTNNRLLRKVVKNMTSKKKAPVAIKNTVAAITSINELSPFLFDDFIKFIDRCEKTTRTYITNLRQFIVWLRYMNIKQPQRKDIFSYRDYLEKEHEVIRLDSKNPNGWSYKIDKNGKKCKVTCKPNTVAQYLRSVCQFFRWTASNGFYPNIADNIHTPKIRHDVHRKDALTAADVLTIEKSIINKAKEKVSKASNIEKDTIGRINRATEQGKRLYAMYLLAVNAGLRTIEISRANIKDLEIKGGNAYLYVWGKGHTEADTKKPIAYEVYTAIQEYLNNRSDYITANSPLFVSTGNRSGGKRIASTTISTMLKRAMQQAGFNSDRITAHTLRHTAGTNAQEITGNLYLTQKYMRHSNPATTEIYLHNNTDRQQAELAQRLYDFYHSTDEKNKSQTEIGNLLQTMTTEQLEQIVKFMKTLEE